jgi:signal transduction histidine kinase
MAHHRQRKRMYLSFLRSLFDRAGGRPVRWPHVALSALLLILVTITDYVTGYELLFSIFYLLPVGILSWVVSPLAGVVASIVAVSVSLVGDLASGAQYSSEFVPYWNVLISISFYLTMVVVLTKLRTVRDELERRVLERTTALRDEIHERKQLEIMLTDVSDREQQRIGIDLHDGLCQHLTGTALAAQVLKVQIEGKSPAEAAQADRLVTMIETGISLSRSVARGLAPVDLDERGLMTALRELSNMTTEQSGIRCQLRLPEPVLLRSSHVTTQLFRIAQEAVRNAVKHSRARLIQIGLSRADGEVVLVVDDDGIGLPDRPSASGGMGLHIMRHRASIIGAAFEAQQLERGTRIEVRVSDEKVDECVESERDDDDRA